MFGALNRFISQFDASPQGQGTDGDGSYGFQVLRNTSAEIQLEPWFDFIIGINGRTINSSDPSLFSTEINNSRGTTISLGVWSAKGQRIREAYVALPPDSLALGLSLQWSPLSSTEDVWHILDVMPDSPADSAGLLAYGDFIIGSPDGLVRGENGLGELVEDFLDRPLRLHVYNHEFDVTRPVTITPSRNWGGSGALGCVLGFGALHRIPAALDEPPQAPGETLFESDKTEAASAAAAAAAGHPLSRPGGDHPSGPTVSPSSADFLIPANLPFEKPLLSTTGPPKTQRKNRAAHPGAASALTFDDYFKEGEEKSREEDVGATKSSPDIVPPPPRATPVEIAADRKATDESGS